jgi:cytochrome c oxidase subunit IV
MAHAHPHAHAASDATTSTGHSGHAGHAGHDDHGGHFIVPIWILRATLGALLFFTLLTVGVAQAEVWIADVFHIKLPGLLNVIVAMSIASVKTLIVVMFFMQLRWDSPLNTMVFVFTIITVIFFLGFTAIDLGGRGTLDRRKAHYVVAGGTGVTGELIKGTVMDGMPANTPIVTAAVISAKQKGKFDPKKMAHEESRLQGLTDAGYLAELPDFGSSSTRSRPVKGVTIPGLPGFKPAKDHHHHDETAPAAAPAPANDPSKE